MARSLERAIKLHLRHAAGGERFAIDASARPALSRALAQDLMSAAPLDDLLASLRLAAAMDGALRSPAVAALIRAVMQSDPRAVHLLRGRRARASGLDTVRRFSRQQDRCTPVRAPVLDHHAPVGAIPLRTLLNPGKDQERAVTARRARRVGKNHE